MKVVITSGYFDPLHVGHIEYLEMAKKLGDLHICIVNSDNSCVLKKGKAFMPEEDRRRIVGALKSVDIAVRQIDQDHTVRETLKTIADVLNGNINELIFAKGGDRFATEIPEGPICDQYKITMVDGLGEKIRSSSEIVDNG
jgi:cytidyltransferase-like protein